MIVTVVGSGTSQGVPVIACHCTVCKSDNKKDHRLRSSIHIQHHGKSIVIDTGPDFRQQMLQNQIEYLDAVLFTHEHKDHVAGLDDVRPYNFKQKNQSIFFVATEFLKHLKENTFMSLIQNSNILEYHKSIRFRYTKTEPSKLEMQLYNL